MENNKAVCMQRKYHTFRHDVCTTCATTWKAYLKSDELSLKKLVNDVEKLIKKRKRPVQPDFKKAHRTKQLHTYDGVTK